MSLLSAAAKAKLKFPAGRNSATELTAAIFGAYGFLGRYIANELGSVGGTLIVPYRGDEMEIRHLKVVMDLGNYATIPFDPRDRESIHRAVEGVDVVVNLIGKHYETKHLLPWWINYSYDEANCQTAKTIAEVAAEAGVPRFIHHSSILAAPDSPCQWAASKYRGEMAVQRAFPNANIVRSSIIYGTEDRFLNWYGKRLVGGGIPLIDNGEARLQPVFCNDVARGIFALMMDETIQGKVFEFAGDEEYTAKEIADYVIDFTKRDPSLYNLPLPVAKAIGKFCEYFPNPHFTSDLAVMMTLDQVKKSRRPGLRELGIEPSKLEKEAPNMLMIFERGGHFQEVSGYH